MIIIAWDIFPVLMHQKLYGHISVVMIWHSYWTFSVWLDSGPVYGIITSLNHNNSFMICLIIHCYEKMVLMNYRWWHIIIIWSSPIMRPSMMTSPIPVVPGTVSWMSWVMTMMTFVMMTPMTTTEIFLGAS